VTDAMKIAQLAQMETRLEVAVEALEAAREIAEDIDHAAHDRIRMLKDGVRERLLGARIELSALGTTRVG
jgi:hypothetical protein